MTQPAVPSKRYIFCNRCKGETVHTCEGEHQRFYSTENTLQLESWRFWVCAGCEQGVLERAPFYNLHPEDPECGEWFPDEQEYFPPRTRFSVGEKHFTDLPPKLDRIYREMLRAFNNEMPILCAVAVRALIEGICVDRGIDDRNLEKQIDRMSSILPPNIIDGLHSIRFIGNVATHDLMPPEGYELRLAIEICENLLNYLYELDYKASYLARVRQGKQVQGPDRPEIEDQAGLEEDKA